MRNLRTSRTLAHPLLLNTPRGVELTEGQCFLRDRLPHVPTPSPMSSLRPGHHGGAFHGDWHAPPTPTSSTSGSLNGQPAPFPCLVDAPGEDLLNAASAFVPEECNGHGLCTRTSADGVFQPTSRFLLSSCLNMTSHWLSTVPCSWETSPGILKRRPSSPIIFKQKVRFVGLVELFVYEDYVMRRIP